MNFIFHFMTIIFFGFGLDTVENKECLVFYILLHLVRLPFDIFIEFFFYSQSLVGFTTLVPVVNRSLIVFEFKHLELISYGWPEDDAEGPTFDIKTDNE